MKEQNKLTLTISAAVLVILIIGGYLLYRHKHQTATLPVTGQEIPAILPPSSDINVLTPTSPAATPASNTTATPAADPWDIFQKYLGYLKNHDEAGVTSLLSPQALQYGNACPMRQGTIGKDCDSFMDAAYASGSTLKKADFVNNWNDSKQIILSTNVYQLPEDTQGKRSYEKMYLFFTKDANGTPKFLISHKITTTISYTIDTLQKKITEAMNSFKDSDQDGIPDIYEDCKTSGANPYQSQCSNTSGNKRDSLGDGWWDGVRVYFKPQ